MNKENQNVAEEILNFLAKNKREYFSIREISSEVNGNFHKVTCICTKLVCEDKIRKDTDIHGMNVYRFKSF